MKIRLKTGIAIVGIGLSFILILAGCNEGQMSAGDKERLLAQGGSKTNPLKHCIRQKFYE